MKGFIIVGLSVALLSAFSNTATAMRAFRYAADEADTQETTVDEADETTVDDADETTPADADGEEECSLLPILYDQPPEDDEHWPGCRE